MGSSNNPAPFNPDLRDQIEQTFRELVADSKADVRSLADFTARKAAEVARKRGHPEFETIVRDARAQVLIEAGRLAVIAADRADDAVWGTIVGGLLRVSAIASAA